MKAIKDRPRALGEGLAAIRTQFQLPGDFPPEVRAAAEAAARKPLADHVDRTEVPFVTLDPASSTDLDQAFAIEQSGSDLVLRYAIADVAWFVADGDPVDAEAWRRGETIYMPDERISLYPSVLSEGAASLLPDAPKAAIIFTVRVASDGGCSFDAAERAIVRSRAKLGYATVRAEDLPDGFAELSRRIEASEQARGASRVDPPQQQVLEQADGTFRLEFRPMSAAEQANSGLSLAANLAIAELMYRHGTGLFRVMPEPGDWAVRRLRHSAKALGVDWPKEISLQDRERQLDPNDPKDAAFMLAIRRSGTHASYAPFRQGERPWHS
ncbi:MAG TPA: RNB domain-containing ribonuclease, partial [Sphingomicrobium sp.]|nr:RNB domain-containing ribonuclease [Sphingomicrobium sp.]